MIHTKLFTRRLANVLWLLAAGLALGWTSVEAAEIRLFVDREWVREEAGRTEISVIAKHYDDSGELAKVSDDTYVNLTPSTAGFNSRFTIEQATLIIRQDKSSASGTIIFTPVEDDLKGNDDMDDGSADDLRIDISGSAGATPVIPTSITLIDNDKESQNIRLTFSPAMLDKWSGPVEIVVTAELDGKVLTRDVSFQLLIDEANSEVARDTDYSTTLAPIEISRRKASGTATITIAPRGQGTGIITVTGNPVGINVIAGQISITAAILGITNLTATPASVREDAEPTQIGLTFTLNKAPETDETVTFRITSPSSGTKAVRGSDYRATLPPGSTATISAGKTEGTATLTLTPLNNEEKDGDRSLGVQASSSGGASQTDITILDDETLSQSIELSVNPAEIREDAGATNVTITATLTGKVLDEDVVLLFQTDTGTAIRDVDYVRPRVSLTIPAGQTQGSRTVTITPTDDGTEDPDETITFGVAINPQNEDGDPIAVGTATITLKDTGKRVDPPAGDTTPTFADAAADLSATVGTVITPVVLPAGSGGTGDLTYSVSTLPAGLSFDAATRTLSGTPTAETNGAVTILYTVLDSTRANSVLRFTITVEPVADANILLTVEPTAISEDAGVTDVMVTGTLDGKVFDDAVVVTLAFDEDVNGDGKAAVSEIDYTAVMRRLTIPPGSVSGKTTITITPINDKKVEGDETIRLRLRGAYNQITVQDVEGVDVKVRVVPVDITLQDTGEGGGASFFSADAAIAAQTYTVGAAIVDLVLPEASDGPGELVYGISALPTGLSFDAATRTLSGTPSAETNGAVTIVYTATDESGITDTLSFTITVNPCLCDAWDMFLDLFSGETGAEEPEESSLAFVDDAAIAAQTYTVGVAIVDLVLPEASGGTGELMYSVSALPAGLSFDPSTRTLSGTPSAATDGAVDVVYTVVDGGGQVAALPFSITVNKQLSFGDFFSLFGSGKVVPTDAHDGAAIREFVVGQRVESLALPEASGGTDPLTYSLSPALPAGLTFDPGTRIIAGTPQMASEAVYTYRVTDANGATASLSLQTLPTAFSLADNFPNPFNPATTIHYALPTAADVELTVYNVAGQVVRTLVAGYQSAGRYVVEWDATNDSGHSLSAGLYFYRLQAGGEFAEAKKMLLLK